MRRQGSVLFLLAAVCALSVLCYALAAETYRKNIYEEEPQEQRLLAGLDAELAEPGDQEARHRRRGAGGCATCRRTAGGSRTR